MAIAVARSYPLGCGTATATLGSVFSKRAISQERLTLAATAQQRSIEDGQEATETSIKDRVVLRTTQSGYVEDVAAEATARFGLFGETAFLSNTPEVASGEGASSGQFLFEHVSDGLARVTATAADGLSLVASVEISSGLAASSDRWERWAESSLGNAVLGGFQQRAASSSQMAMYSTLNHTTPAYVRNSSCWLTGIDVSCISVWNSYGGQQRAGTLVTPRHAVLAKHFSVPTGTTLRFVSNGSGALTHTDVTVEASQTSSDVLDMQVVKFSAEVPYQFCSVISPALLDCIPSVTSSPGTSYLPSWIPRVPLIATSQDKDIGYKSLASLGDSWSSWYSGVSVNGSAVLENYETLRPNVRSGCSGHPTFLLIDGELALVGLYFGANGGPAFSSQAMHDFVSAALTTLGGGYQLTTVDLSGFPTY